MEVVCAWKHRVGQHVTHVDYGSEKLRGVIVQIIFLGDVENHHESLTPYPGQDNTEFTENEWHQPWYRIYWYMEDGTPHADPAAWVTKFGIGYNGQEHEGALELI